jgi:hypothetical protein
MHHRLNRSIENSTVTRNSEGRKKLVSYHLYAVQQAGMPEVGVSVRKLSQLSLLSKAKRANPRYFIILCEISCELAGCVLWPIVDSKSMIAG